MLNLQEQSPCTRHINRNLFIFAVGLLVSLAASGTKTQLGNSNTTVYASQETTSTTKYVNETSSVPTVLKSSPPPVDPELRFCNQTFNYTYETICQQCDKGRYDPCKAGDTHIRNKTCTAYVEDFMRVSVQGCQALCLKERVSPRCCHGYYGANCTKICPGGIKNPCNGHGKCLDLIGSCVCKPEFKGTACELCTDKTKYGQNCTQDCMCTSGACNSGIFGDGGCTPDNPCNKSETPCGANNQCLHTGPGTYQCICSEGFASLDNTCVLLDPCLVNNGGCDITQDCISQNSSKPKCQCKAGYEIHRYSRSCKLTDMCRAGLCGSFADCETREPLKHTCVCHGSYSWTGEACSGNIMEILRELSTEDARFKDNIWYMLNITSQTYDTFLTRYGPFTIFVPTDQAFRKAFNKTELDELMNSDTKMKQLLQQHVAAGKYKTSIFNSFYNLQGNQAQLRTVKGNDTVQNYYTVTYDSTVTETSAIIASDVIASNGVIQLISDVMGLKDNQFKDGKETVMDLIKNNPDYSTLYSMIKAANLVEMFSQPNTTVLIIDNKAWSNLSLHDQNYLVSDEDGLSKLALILKMHIFPGVLEVTDLINLYSIKSAANIRVRVHTSRQGQIILNTDVSITRVNIPVSSGLCHRLDKVIIPSYLTPFMKNVCEETKLKTVQGPCKSCQEHLPCSKPTDEPTGEKRVCHDYGSWYSGLYHRYGLRPYWHSYRDGFLDIWDSPHFVTRTLKCSAVCLQKTKNKACCSGFYGPNCSPCPGGFKNPCSGNGKCSDGKTGTGLCLCNNNFAGTACNRCANNNTFGTFCEKTCTCQFGQCDSGPKGTGKCKPATCEIGYTGENCDEKLVPCETEDLCQANSECFLGEDGINSCFCAPGYQNNEDNCLEIDLCADDNSPCHQQATCSLDVPVIINCTCNKGWHGDGFHCMPNYPCSGNTDCHKDAVCHDVAPGQYHCVCKTGFRGNGLTCELFDLCVVNNGGCHPEAQCTFIKDLERNCTCPELMTGDGIMCRGTIAEEVKNHPRLTKLRDIMKVVNPSNMILDTMNTTFTFFAPSDSAMASFFESTRSQTTADYWRQEENVLSFLNFHSLDNYFTTDDMLAFSGVIRHYPTLYDGFSLRIVNTNKSLHIFANHSKFALIEEANISAVNGYFHIIDKVLEPFIPDEEAPSLNDTLSSRPQYRLFYEALKKTKLLETVSALNEYTLFVLSDENFKKIGRKVTANFLKYYIVPQLIFTPCISEAVEEYETLLGSGYSLSLYQVSDQVWVNYQAVIQSDILTEEGVVHELETAIHPILNHCILNTTMTDLGQCGDCMAGDLDCNLGFQSLGSEHVLKYKCHFHKNADDDWETAGCQQICVQHKSESECCGGFYGNHCDECPGGAENPCSGNGVCSEGKSGSGRCKCNTGFSGTVCDKCERTDLVPPFCNVSYNSCGYLNGNCSDHAWCNETSNGVTCQCFSGYVGDGHTCTSPCDNAENGGCHSWANCILYETNHTFRCECNPGFHGNGTWCTQNSDPCASQNGGCDLERALCNFTQPKVTDMDDGDPFCECKTGYIGDGKLCSTNLLDAISRIPELSSLYTWLLTDNNGGTNLTQLCCDQSKQRTVFASVSKLIKATSITVVDGIIELPVCSDKDDEVKNNISKEKPQIDDIKHWTLKSLKGQVIDIILKDQEKCLVNGVRIVRENIRTLNGILHLIAAPLDSSEDAHSLKSTTTDKADSHSKSLIGFLVAAATVALVVLLVIIIYKKRDYLFRHPPTNSHCNIKFSKINSDDNGDTVSIPDNTQYHNPLFNNQQFQ